jgi:1-deoxy-D-xylulose-5-phosphate reductoisomerase
MPPDTTSSSPATPRRVVILGATGSIGRQAVQIVEHLAEHCSNNEGQPPLKIVGLSAGSNAEELFAIAQRHHVVDVALHSSSSSTARFEGNLRTGPDASAQLVRDTQPDLVLAAIVGLAGLPAVMAAVELGIDVAMANKESLVAGGALVTRTAKQSGSRILPVDSEHAALWQCLGRHDAPPAQLPQHVRKLILTASGGPFRTWSAQRMQDATPQDALNHPTWSMGPKVTVDCASLMNKSLELLEAHWLFQAPPEQLDVLIHPSSISHAIVQFIDGSSLAQLAAPSMLVPIQQAMTYPDVFESSTPPSDLAACPDLQFEAVDRGQFPAIELAFEVMRLEGLSGAILNAANEAAVEAFLKRAIPFGGIVPVVTNTLRELHQRYESADIYDLCAITQVSDHARARAAEHCNATNMTTGTTRP